MEQSPRLSDREWQVVKLLLQGKSNKMIASSLGVSKRTIEFHLKNIYAKFQVSTRLELILKLVNATGGIEFEKLVHSTVAGTGEVAENRDRLNSRMGWAMSFRDTVSIIGKEPKMKNLLSAKHVFTGMATALLAGFLWVFFLINNNGDLSLSADDFTAFTIPLIIILAMIGLTVGVIGKQKNITLLKTFLSVLIGTGLSPFAVIPLMIIFVMPIEKLAAKLEMSDKFASDLAMAVMITLWLIAGITIGITLLFVSIKKTQQIDNQSQAS